MNSKFKKCTVASLPFVICHLVFGMMLMSCTSQSSGYVINGTVEGLEEGSVLTLTSMSRDGDSTLAEATVKGGKFQFKGEVAEPVCAHIKVKDGWGGPDVILENVEMSVEGKIVNVEETQNGIVYQWDTKVTGSPLTDKLATFDARYNKLDTLYEEFQKKYAVVFEKLQTLQDTEIEAYKLTDEFKEADEANDSFFKMAEETIMCMVKENKDNFWGPLLAMKYITYFNKSHRELWNSFSDEAKQSYYGRKMQLELWPAMAVADRVNQFVLTGEDGQEYNFKRLAEGKKYVLLDFWASWCGPCRKELPNVKAQYAKYKDKGFEVVSISVDKDEAAWKKAVEEEQMVWPNFRSDEVANLFKVTAVPTVYVIDATGKIVADGEDARGEGLQHTLAKLFE